MSGITKKNYRRIREKRKEREDERGWINKFSELRDMLQHTDPEHHERLYRLRKFLGGN